MNVRLVDDKTALAKPVAAEDLHRQDYIAVLNETLEYRPSCGAGIRI
jgi:hypothetical protein